MIHKEDDAWVDRFNNPEKQQQKKLFIEMKEPKKGRFIDDIIKEKDERIADLEAELLHVKAERDGLQQLFDFTREELERKEAILSEYRNYIKW